MLTTQRRAGDIGKPQETRTARGASMPAGAAAPARRPVAPATHADALAGQLARVVASRSEGGPMLQRWPAERVTAHEMSAERIKGKDRGTKMAKFADLRAKHRDDAHEIIEDLDVADVWGGLKSNITGTGKQHSVRIDRQNPTATHSNIQIQTNGDSVTIATVLISDALIHARPGPLKHHIRAAFKASLLDGMQWEVYNR